MLYNRLLEIHFPDAGIVIGGRQVLVQCRVVPARTVFNRVAWFLVMM